MRLKWYESGNHRCAGFFSTEPGATDYSLGIFANTHETEFVARYSREVGNRRFSHFNQALELMSESAPISITSFPKADNFKRRE